MSREKELEIVNNATRGRWKLTPTGVVAEDGAFLAFAQLDTDTTFIATFNPERVSELLDENHEVTRLLAERDLKLNYANKSIHRLESRLDAVENRHQPEPARYYGTDLNPSREYDCKACGEGTSWPCADIKAARGE